MSAIMFNHVFFGESALFFALLRSLYVHGLNKGPFVVIRHQDDLDESMPRPVIINDKFIFNICRLPPIGVNNFNEYLCYLSSIAPNSIVELSLSDFKWLYYKQTNLFIISTCRSGLCGTYAPLLNHIGCKGVIVSFDNDKMIAKKAQAMLPGFKVEAGMAHACTLKTIDAACVELVVEEHILFAFPNKEFRKYFDFCMPTPEVVFCETNKELVEYYEKKLVFINVPHTVLTLNAYAMNEISRETSEISYLQLENIEEIVHKTIDDCMHIQKVFVDRNGLEREEAVDWNTLCLEFILFTVKNDTLERGLRWDRSTVEKLNKHLQYISELNNSRLMDVARALVLNIEQYLAKAAVTLANNNFKPIG